MLSCWTFVSTKGIPPQRHRYNWTEVWANLPVLPWQIRGRTRKMQANKNRPELPLPDKLPKFREY